MYDCMTVCVCVCVCVCVWVGGWDRHVYDCMTVHVRIYIYCCLCKCTYVAVPGRNQTLFCCVFRLHYLCSKRTEHKSPALNRILC